MVWRYYIYGQTIPSMRSDLIIHIVRPKIWYGQTKKIISSDLKHKPKCRSWILVFSRKERKDRKAYRDGGVLLDFQARPLFWAFTNRVNCRTERTACIINNNIPSLCSLRSLRQKKQEGYYSTAIFRVSIASLVSMPVGGEFWDLMRGILRPSEGDY